MIKKCSVDKGIGIHYRTDQKTLPQKSARIDLLKKKPIERHCRCDDLMDKPMIS